MEIKNKLQGGEENEEVENMGDSRKMRHHATKLVKFLTSDGWVRFRARK